jgi:predicted MFS family arabinose efflux permease
VAAVVLVGAFFLLPKDDPRPGGVSIDLPGAVTATSGLVLLVSACIEGPDLGWGNSIVVALLIGAVVLLSAFFVIESRTARPLMPLRLLRHSSLPTGMLICALFASAFGAQYFLLTTYLQDIRHLAPGMAGLAFLPFALSIVLGTRVGGRLVNRLGLRTALLVGLVLGIAGLLMIALNLSADGSYATRLLPGFLLDGLGQGITWTLMWIAATSGIATEDRGIASGMASTAQQSGAALGLALLVGIATAGLPAGASVTIAASVDAIISGIRSAFFAAAALAGLAALVAIFRIPPRQPTKPVAASAA